MKRSGEFRRFRPLVAALVAGGVLIAGGPATAGQIDATGVTVSWDDTNLGAAPNGEGCREFDFPWRNNGPATVKIMRLTLTSAAGTSIEDARSGPGDGFIPGDYGNFVMSACIRDGFRPGTPVSVKLTTTSADYRTTQSAVGTFVMGSSPNQKMVSVTKAPCTPSNRADVNARFCRGGNVLMLKDSSLWIGGTDSESFSLFNKSGAVPLKESFGFELTPSPNAERGTAFFRIDGTKFKPGKYMVIATGGEPEAWKCSISRTSDPVLTCRWDSGFSAISGYSFRWNGEQVTDVKKASKRDLKRYRL